MKIFVINGPAGVGKDTFVTYVDNYLRNEDNSKAISLSSVGGIKFIASTYFNYKESVKSDKDRKFLADLKQLTDDYCNYSFKYVDEEIQKILDNNKADIYTKVSAIFIMCREPEKIEKFKEIYHAKTIFVDSNRVIHQVTNNESDKNVRDFNYDITVLNNGDLSSLSNTAIMFAYHEILDKDPEVKINLYQ